MFLRIKTTVINVIDWSNLTHIFQMLICFSCIFISFIIPGYDSRNCNLPFLRNHTFRMVTIPLPVVAFLLTLSSLKFWTFLTNIFLFVIYLYWYIISYQYHIDFIWSSIKFNSLDGVLRELFKFFSNKLSLSTRERK